MAKTTEFTLAVGDHVRLTSRMANQHQSFQLTRDEMAKIIGQTTTNWDFNVAKNLAEANLTAAAAADASLGVAFRLEPARFGCKAGPA